MEDLIEIKSLRGLRTWHEKGVRIAYVEHVESFGDDKPEMGWRVLRLPETLPSGGTRIDCARHLDGVDYEYPVHVKQLRIKNPVGPHRYAI